MNFNNIFKDENSRDIITEAYKSLQTKITENKSNSLSVIRKEDTLIVINKDLETNFHFRHISRKKGFDYFTVPWFPMKQTNKTSTGYVTLVKIDITTAQLDFCKKLLTGLKNISESYYMRLEVNNSNLKVVNDNRR